MTASITGVTLHGRPRHEPTRTRGFQRRRADPQQRRRSRSIASASRAAAPPAAAASPTPAARSSIDRSLIDNNGNIGGGGRRRPPELRRRHRRRPQHDDHGQPAPTHGGGVLLVGRRRRPNNTALFEFVTIARNTGGGAELFAPGDTLQMRGSIVAPTTPAATASRRPAVARRERRRPATTACSRQRGAQATRSGATLENLGGDTDVLCSVRGQRGARPHPGRPVPADGSARRRAPDRPGVRRRRVRGRHAAVVDHVARARHDDGRRRRSSSAAPPRRTRPSSSTATARRSRRRARTPKAQWAVTVNLEPGEQTFEVEAPGVPRASVRVVRTVPVQQTPTPTPTATPTPRRPRPPRRS